MAVSIYYLFWNMNYKPLNAKSSVMSPYVPFVTVHSFSTLINAVFMQSYSLKKIKQQWIACTERLYDYDQNFLITL